MSSLDQSEAREKKHERKSTGEKAREKKHGGDAESIVEYFDRDEAGVKGSRGQGVKDLGKYSTLDYGRGLLDS